MAELRAKGRASGKFILLGEHFVVGGAEAGATPALAFPLHDLWCEVRLASNHHPHYKATIEGEGGGPEIEGLMARATYAAADSLRIDLSAQPIRVESRANFPVSRGFGSSAAFAVALVRAFDEMRGAMIQERADWQEIAKATSTVERIFHGQPSGVDGAVVLAGRPVRFEKGAVLRELSNRAVDFVLVDSGSRENCAALIQRVRDFRSREPGQWESMAAVVRESIDACEAALAKGDAATVAGCVSRAQGILAELGLSTPAIEAVLGAARERGALAGKVSGAGGGGAVALVAARSKGAELAKAMREAGCSVLAVSAGGARG